jgi:hypothetical protein
MADRFCIDIEITLQYHKNKRSASPHSQRRKAKVTYESPP